MESCLLLLKSANLDALTVNETNLNEHFPGCNSQGGVIGLPIFLAQLYIPEHDHIQSHIT